MLFKVLAIHVVFCLAVKQFIRKCNLGISKITLKDCAMKIDDMRFHADPNIGKLMIDLENVGNESFVSACYEQLREVTREYVSEANNECNRIQHSNQFISAEHHDLQLSFRFDLNFFNETYFRYSA